MKLINYQAATGNRLGILSDRGLLDVAPAAGSSDA